MSRGRSIDRILILAPMLGFLWGLAEGTVFFVIPDVLLSFVAMFSWGRFMTVLGATLLGSLTAGVAVYEAASYGRETTYAVLQAVPFVTPKMFIAAQSDYARDGIWALASGPVSGIPYKIYAFLAPAHATILPFLLVSIPARLGRYLVIGSLSYVAGLLSRRYRNEQSNQLVLAYAICWCVFYTIYWLRVTHT